MYTNRRHKKAKRRTDPFFSGSGIRIIRRWLTRGCSMKKYKVYGVGAALVDTEIKVEDHELSQMQVEKGLMTLVDEARQAELLGHLEGHLVKASHASGGGEWGY